MNARRGNPRVPRRPVRLPRPGNPGLRLVEYFRSRAQARWIEGRTRHPTEVIAPEPLRQEVSEGHARAWRLNGRRPEQ